MDDTAKPYLSTDDVNKRDENGNTALSLAANNVELYKIKILLEKGANVNAGCYNLSYRNGSRLNSYTTFEVSTPLMNVIANYMDYDESIKEVINLMLENGADVNSFDSGGNTAIDICFKKYDWRVLLDVILQYTEPDKIERKEYVIDGDEEYYKKLYLYEKNIMQYNENDFKILLCSREQRDINAKVQLLGKMLELGIVNFMNKSPEEKGKDDIIVCAAILGKPDKVEQLLKNGANVNVRFYREDWSTWSRWDDYKSSTALMCAAEKGNDKIVELLLSDKNIDVNLKANDGLSALSYAIQGQNTKIVEKIGKKVKSGGDNNGLLMTVVKMFNDFKFTDNSLQSFVQAVLNIKGVDVNFKNSEGQTALMYLVSKNTYHSVERIDLIIKTSEEIIKSKGFDLNAQDNDGKTALMFFIQKNSENRYDKSIVEKILKTNDVNVNLKDTSGKTALFYAVDTHDQLFTIANDVRITKAILDVKGVDVNEKDKVGKTALFYAKEPEIAELLLRYKIPVDAVDNYGKTALFYVPSKVIKSLKDADVNIKDKLGKTALSSYIDGSWEPYSVDIERVKELLDLGADVNVEDNKGNTVVMDIIKKLDKSRFERSRELLGILMEILKVPGLDISSFKNQKGYSVITFLFSIELDTEMIKQVLEYCSDNLPQNINVFKNGDEVEYYINYIKNYIKKKKEEYTANEQKFESTTGNRGGNYAKDYYKKKKEEGTVNEQEFESTGNEILKLLEFLKNHADTQPGGKHANEAAISFSKIALNASDPPINYSSNPRDDAKRPRLKFGGQPHRLQKRRSYALLAKRRSFDAKRRSRRKQARSRPSRLLSGAPQA